MKQTLDIWMNGEHVGKWTRLGSEQSFRYVESYLRDQNARPLSLSLPLGPVSKEIKGPEVASFFDNLLPDNADIRQRIQRRYGLSSSSPFDLLSEIGRDCVGALQILPERSIVPDVHVIEGEPLSEKGIEKVLHASSTGSLPGDDTLRISIAGAQEKTALLRNNGQWCKPIGATPTTHIFKLPLGEIGALRVDMRESIEIEWLCLKILEAFGLDVAKADIAVFGTQRTLVVERFDRKLSSDGSWWMRLPQEDLCQALGVSPEKKYEHEGGPGIVEIMHFLLSSSEPQRDRKLFLKTQLLFWLLAAPDGHAKNFSISIGKQGRYSLTPLYDVMSVYPVMGHGARMISPKNFKMAMTLDGHYEWNRILKRHWEETARICGAGSSMKEIFTEMLEQLPGAIDRTSEQLPANFPKEVSSSIFEGMKKAAMRLE
ncbi:type II toxin-antitoxin system HipA family toxin [Sphaerochaeta halotolerans]|uniref:Type II toxin-antitoxin system HipA family toxin n=1 Tax=Sphaerochaeta halotolerans TaxID=2293840 RepID=A0A372MM81_9SPIR|nr:type II toxin-antitoxin system HipA family toxin [Sphaerochaeta halotolerans]RFU96260.1 type II toxin-antitoxin system HipA family toxin [Sphaerochaeta halotolerans]